MTDNLFTTGLGAIVIISAFTLNALSKRAERKRIRASLAASPCTACGKAYGFAALTTADEVHYNWTLSRGNTAASLRLPHSTLLIICPHCSAEAEYEENGRVFFHPQTGVIGFTRFAISKMLSRPTFGELLNPRVKRRAKSVQAFHNF
jgi:hypothetical protein